MSKLLEMHFQLGDVRVQSHAMGTVCREIKRPRFELAVLSLERRHLLEQSRVLTLDRPI